MENYIINPWAVYFIEMLPRLEFLFVVTLIFSIAVMLVILAEDMLTEEDAKQYLRWALTVVVISLLALVVIPTTSTMYKMVAADYLTVDKAQILEQELEKFSTKLTNALKNKE